MFCCANTFCKYFQVLWNGLYLKLKEHKRKLGDEFVVLNAFYTFDDEKLKEMFAM